MDYILNGAASGEVAERLMAVNFDSGALRPWTGKDGRAYITVNQGGTLKNVLIGHANTTLRKDDWNTIDAAVLKAAQPRLKAVQDLRSRGLVYSIPNGLGKTVLETEKQSDINDATVSMDALQRGANDRPHFIVENLPLPIIHYDFSYSARQIQASRNGGSPLDTTTAELAGRKVSEAAEKLLLGKSAPLEYTFGGGTIYGYTNFNNVLTQTITSPTAGGWTGATLVDELLQARQTCMDQYYYGPWMVYTSPSWDRYLDKDYSTAKGDNTNRERVKKIEGFEDVKTLDYLTGYEILLVQMTSDVVRLVEGLAMTTVQWESEGGLKKNFKVMAIWVPQIRSDFNSRTGVVYCSV